MRRQGPGRQPVNNLRCQKPKIKRYASWRHRGGQISNRRRLSKRPADIEGREQVGHWQRDNASSANHKQAIVTLTERQSEYAVIAKVSKKTAYPIRQAIIKAVTRFEARVKTLTYDNGNDFYEHALIN